MDSHSKFNSGGEKKTAFLSPATLTAAVLVVTSLLICLCGCLVYAEPVIIEPYVEPVINIPAGSAHDVPGKRIKYSFALAA